MVVVEPNEEDEIPLSVHQGHEYHYCVEGRFIMKIGDHEMVVDEGDSVYFQSVIPRNEGVGRKTRQNTCYHCVRDRLFSHAIYAGASPIALTAEFAPWQMFRS